MPFNVFICFSTDIYMPAYVLSYACRIFDLNRPLGVADVLIRVNLYFAFGNILALVHIG